MTSAQTEKASSRLRRAGRARAASTARRAAAYTVLGLLCFLCLFFFYILLINATRTHFEIQRGFSLLPGRSLLTNLKSVLANANIPVLSGIRNSLLVSRSLRCSVFIFQRSPPTASMPMTSNSKSWPLRSSCSS